MINHHYYLLTFYTDQFGFQLYGSAAVLSQKPQPGFQTNQPPTILSMKSTQEDDGSFQFSYKTDEPASVEAFGEPRQFGDEVRVVMWGSYNFTAIDSAGNPVPVVVTWYADENGFHAESDIIPQGTGRIESEQYNEAFDQFRSTSSSRRRPGTGNKPADSIQTSEKRTPNRIQSNSANRQTSIASTSQRGRPPPNQLLSRRNGNRRPDQTSVRRQQTNSRIRNQNNQQVAFSNQQEKPERRPERPQSTVTLSNQQRQSNRRTQGSQNNSSFNRRGQSGRRSQGSQSNSSFNRPTLPSRRPQRPQSTSLPSNQQGQPRRRPQNSRRASSPNRQRQTNGRPQSSQRNSQRPPTSSNRQQQSDRRPQNSQSTSSSTNRQSQTNRRPQSSRRNQQLPSSSSNQQRNRVKNQQRQRNVPSADGRTINDSRRS